MRGCVKSGHCARDRLERFEPYLVISRAAFATFICEVGALTIQTTLPGKTFIEAIVYDFVHVACLRAVECEDLVDVGVQLRPLTCSR